MTLEPLISIDFHELCHDEYEYLKVENFLSLVDFFEVRKMNGIARNSCKFRRGFQGKMEISVLESHGHANWDLLHTGCFLESNEPRLFANGAFRTLEKNVGQWRWKHFEKLVIKLEKAYHEALRTTNKVDDLMECYTHQDCVCKV